MSNPSFGLPSPSLPVSDPKTARVNSLWYSFFARLSQLSAESQISSIAVGASPYVYKSGTIGNIFVAGGTVSLIVLSRSNVSIVCQENSFIPMAANDTVTVTYTVKPTMTFVPSARA